MEQIPKNENSREAAAERLCDFLERIDAYNYFQDILNGKIEKPSFEYFKDFLIRINGIVREIPIQIRSDDGVNARLTSYIETVLVPKHDDKEDLLACAYNSIQSVNKDEIKYLIPAVINAIHFFADGNGRTSRCLYQLMSVYDSKEIFEEELKKSLGEDGRHDSPDIDPGILVVEINRIVMRQNGWQIEGKKWPERRNTKVAGMATAETHKIGTEEKNFSFWESLSEAYGSDAYYVVTAICEVVGDERLDMLLSEYGEQKLRKISPLKMMEILEEDEWNQIIKFFYSLKREHVKTLVDIFVRPNDFKCLDGKTNLKDYFIKEIKRKLEKNKLFV